MASTAVSCNSLFRGLIGFAASQAGEPILTSAGNGPLYTGWAILLLLGNVALCLVCFKGQQWKENTARKKAERVDKKAEEVADNEQNNDTDSIIVEVQR